MRKLLLGGVAAAILTSAATAAQPAPPPPPGVSQGTAPMPHARVPSVHPPMKAMKVQTRDDVIAHARAMFAKLDANRDGYVTREEATAGHKAMAGKFRDKRVTQRRMDRPDRGAMFDRLDANKDGAISREEFAAAQPRRERHVMVMRDGHGPAEALGAPGQRHVRVMRMNRIGARGHGRMFERADADRDNRVTLQEMTSAALQHFDAADANRDGRLTPDERMQLRHQRRAQRQRA